MTSGQAAPSPDANPAARWAATVASLVVGAAFLALWFWLLPSWLGFQVDLAGVGRWRWITAVPSVLGFAVALRCISDFGWTGRGTPAPFVPPQKLVVVGFYRYVRNPMYVAVVSLIFGQGLLFGSVGVLEYGMVVWLGFHIFVLAYEEPTLRATFGDEYTEFSANVRRWLPRVKPWRGTGTVTK